MAQSFPYTYIACPCTDTASLPANSESSKPTDNSTIDEEQEHTFDSRSPRANYALYPLEHLLYCEECHQIRCPRCWVEEIMTWYCPSCLFEYASSMVKSDGNRCTRHCYDCPICRANLSIVSQNEESEKGAEGSNQSSSGPFFLHCPYCSWSSLEIGIQFDKGKEIYSQLQRIKNGGRVVRSQKDKEREQLKLRRQASLGSTSRLEEPMTPRAATEEEGHELDNSDLFHNLNNFYRNQLVEAAGGSALGGAFGALSEYGYGSPATLSRVMSMYGSNFGPTRSKDKPSSMREAENEVEGLRLTQDNDEERIIEQMRTKGWDATTSQEQRIAHPDNMDASLASDLRPVSALLRTKRSKRCRNCRHILVRPEPKVASTRYKIRNLALNYLPSLRLRAFTSAPSLINPATHPLTLAARPISTPNSGLATASTTASMISPSTSLDAIAPATPLSLLITLHNPLFDPVKVTLGTPSLTPPLRSNTPASRSRVTILCPQFDIGASGDVWDEALDAGGKDSKEKSIKDATAALEGSSTAQKQAEAGKVWEKGRNWTSVVMEVVPGVIGQSTPTVLGSFGKGGDGGDGGDGEDEDDAQARFMNEDANILEIPLSIRVEYETEAGPGEGAAVGEKASGGLKDRKEQRELTYWCVLGVGRIAET